MSAIPRPPTSFVPGEGPLPYFTVADYHAMISSGVLGEDDPVELIEGVLVYKMSKNRRHRRATTHLNEWLSDVLPVGWTVQMQDSITLSTSEPEPDAACITEKSVDEADPHPGPADIALVIEVSDSTLAYDRSTKLRIYAVAGIVEYWILNLVDQQIEMYSEPQGSGYASRIVRTIGESIALPATLGGATIDVAALLPPA